MITLALWAALAAADEIPSHPRFPRRELPSAFARQERPQELDEAARALQEAQEALRGRAATPQPPRTAPTPDEWILERARQDAQRAQAEALAGPRLAQARVKRAEQLGALYAQAARPLELPLSLSALPPSIDPRSYPLYLPAPRRHPAAVLLGTRIDEAYDARTCERLMHVAEHRLQLDAWTAQRTAATPGATYEERWADRLLEVRRVLGVEP
jgi:hypothetical protein